MKISRNNIGEHLFDYQLQLIGKTRVDVIDDDRWRFNFTMTRQQMEDFRRYSIPLMQKVFKFNRKKAEDCFLWWNQMFGVRIKN